jgi:hypothetical protein
LTRFFANGLLRAEHSISASRYKYEIRVYAEAMRELIRPIVPVCLAAWESALELKPAA